MTTLQPYRQTVVTPDTYEAMCRLERAAHEHGDITLSYGGVPAKLASWEGVDQDAGPLGLSSWKSMRPTGREVYLRIESPKMVPDHKIAVLWSLAVPLGFVPWDRYPVPSPTSHVFHYLGPWSTVGDFLHGEGRGDLAWPSMVCAAQVEVGTWGGNQIIERTVQMHLHRLGIHCGPVDGIIGPVTIAAMKALGMGGMEISRVAEDLAKMALPSAPREDRVRGHVVLGGYPMEAFSSGGVRTVETRQGYALTVDGPGRLILVVGER